MSDIRNIASGKRRYLIGLILLSFISVICVAFSMGEGADFDIAKREVLLRKIGHELLLQSGDSTSRVLPIEKSAANKYQIRFERELTFQPASLVGITRRILAQDPLASDYIVNVLNCGKSSVAYGYAISQNKKDDIVACIGRVQPKACYRIHIEFEPTEMSTVKNIYLFGSLPFLAFVGFLFLRSVRPHKNVSADQDTGMLTLGSVLFDVKTRTLLINGNIIELTGTESRVLFVFASSPNKIIERTRLQKEIWEDEGVIVGRSLDMFISKLRKKLESDPAIKIAVIRGKGYKLEINA